MIISQVARTNEGIGQICRRAAQLIAILTHRVLPDCSVKGAFRV